MGSLRRTTPLGQRRTTDLTKTQLNTVLSALDGKPRNPNTKGAALKAIGRHAETLGISVDDILSATGGLLDESIGPEQFRSSLQADTATKGDVPAEEIRPRRSRGGTKQATMIAMLRRSEGATVDQIAEVTGWQNHTIRGAIAGALKKKLGLTITTERVRSVGPNKDGARGSYTIYRITDAA